MGMMGMLRGNFAERGVRLWVRVWSDEWILVVSSGLYRKAQGKTCTQAFRNRRRDRKSMDCGACIGQWWGSTRHRMEQAMRIGIWVEWELRQGEAWPSFGVCEGVFISFKLFSPADGHPWQLSLRMDPGNPGNPDIIPINGIIWLSNFGLVN